MMKRWSFLAGLLGMAVAVLGTGCGGNPNLSGGKLHFDQAGRLENPTERAARFRRARDTFRKAVDELPKSGEPRLRLGMTYGELGQPDSARIWFEDAVRTDSLMKQEVQDARDHYWSQTFTAGQASAKAAQDAEIGENKPKADSLYRYSLVEYRKAMIYSPDRMETYRDRGVAYVHLGMVDSALVAFATAQKYAPNDTKIRSYRIAVLRREGDRLREAGKTAADVPDTSGAVVAYKAAQRCFQQALDLGTADAGYYNWNLGVISYELANLVPAERVQFRQAAIDYYQRVLTDDPTYLDVLYNLFILYKDGGESQKTIEIAKRMVDLRPKEGTYWGLYGAAQRLAKNDKRVYGPIAIRESLSQRGEVIAPAQAQSRATTAGATSDVMRRFRENGAPDDIRAFKDPQGAEVENWFYWTRGTAYGFLGGAERYAESFAPSGVLAVSDEQIVDRNGAKFITGTVNNSGNYAYQYCRVEFNVFGPVFEKGPNGELVQVFDKGPNGEKIEKVEQIGWVFSSVDKVDPKGKWNFEIPLIGEVAKATRIESPDPAYPANGF